MRNRRANSRSAPMLAEPTTPGFQPTPAFTRNRFSAGTCWRTLQNSVPSPSAVRRAVWLSNSSKSAPCKAETPSSAKISCCRMRASSARSVTSGPVCPGAGSTRGGFGVPESVMLRSSWKGDNALGSSVARQPGSRPASAIFRLGPAVSLGRFRKLLTATSVTIYRGRRPRSSGLAEKLRFPSPHWSVAP